MYVTTVNFSQKFCQKFVFFFQSFYQSKAYVVTQAMKTKPACVEFWRMVWELNSNCIVMLTKVFDFMKVSSIKTFVLQNI